MQLPIDNAVARNPHNTCAEEMDKRLKHLLRYCEEVNTKYGGISIIQGDFNDL